MKLRKTWLKIKTVLFAALVSAGAIAFVYRVEKNWAVIQCPFRFLTGCDCPFCGLGRSLEALIYGHWKDIADYYPALTWLLCCFSVFIFLKVTRFFAAKNPGKWFKATAVCLIGGQWLLGING